MLKWLGLSIESLCLLRHLGDELCLTLRVGRSVISATYGVPVPDPRAAR